MAQIDPVTGLPMSGMRMSPTQSYQPYGSPSVSPGIPVQGATSYAPTTVPTAGGYSSPTGGAGDSYSGGGGQIDYMSLIQQNPYFKQAKALLGDPSAGELGSQGVANLNDLQNAFKSNIIKFGYVPGDTSKFPGVNQSYLGQFAGQDVQNLAGQNQFSVKALEDRAQGETIRDTRAELASRGLLDSGEQNYLLGQGDTGMGTAGGKVGFQYAQQQDQDLQQLMGLLSGAQSSYQNAENQRLMAYQQALYNSMMAAIQQAQQMGARPGPSAPTQAPAQAPAPAPAQGPYHGQTYNAQKPGFTQQDVYDYRYTHPFNPNR